MGRFDTDNNKTNLPEDMTWRTLGKLGGRQKVPVKGAWRRLYAGPKRIAMLDEVFASELKPGRVVAVSGPRGSGKSAIALAACDLRNLEAVYATAQSNYPAYKPRPEICVIVDPVSAFEQGSLESLIKFYRENACLILVDRNENLLQSIINLETDALIKLKLPSEAAISDYLKKMLIDYENTLQELDYLELAALMQGMSFPQINQVAVDAALARLQYAKPVDRGAFDEALSAFSMIHTQVQE